MEQELNGICDCFSNMSQLLSLELVHCEHIFIDCQSVCYIYYTVVIHLIETCSLLKNVCN